MTSPAAPGNAQTSLPAVFRPTLTRVVLLGVGGALVVVMTVMSFLLESFTAGDRATFIGTGLLGLGVLALLARPKVVATPEGVTVVNLTTVRRLAWAEIVRVNLRPGDSWVHLDLADGTTLPAMGIQPGMAREQAITQARTLNALVAELGTGRATT
ncbi:PH domain-containing protein [Streptomyces huiliensis]|uniref:PH domain-containing protein n=1 Tax=Streptomyces huiliensis TaxID=2876027 RepID=UPI001CBF148F|nr:PH domain-containing protein [Streptomyces huiliensis]MBZ4318641.1 PH domain-containing protein [Streptomyces huiliensis]